METDDSRAALTEAAKPPWDESRPDGDAAAAAAFATAHEALEGMGLQAAADRVRERIADQGARFGGSEAPFTVDPVPRIIGRDEWARLERSLAQRARALDAFVADVHGERRAIADGIVPAAVVDACPFVVPDLVGLDDPPRVRVAVAGLDVVRDADGTLRVIEDNARVPSGMAYMLASRRAVEGTIGRPDDVRDLTEAVGPALSTALRATTPVGAEPGAAVLLSDGPGNTAWWEHERLAELMDVPLVRPEDLRSRGDRLELRDGGEPVSAVYRRTDVAALRDPDGGLSALGELLLPALRAGTVGVMNGFETGVADDKAVYPYVGDLIRYFCGEPPLIADIPVHDLTDERARDAVLDRAAELVFKPRDGQGGHGVVLGPWAPPDELRRVIAAVRAKPSAWIAQDVVTLSTHPTVIDGRLEPRHVDLRPFLLADGDGGWKLLPGALTRVALERGEMVVNSSRGGGSKDTWVLR
ncbi:MAG: circularly permuted type 2 ATP-grasp protein [Patulibacter sp.]